MYVNNVKKWVEVPKFRESICEKKCEKVAILFTVIHLSLLKFYFSALLLVFESLCLHVFFY